MTESSVYHDDVPGTVLLVDINGMNSSGPHDSQHKDIVLVPRPSSDPNDPLNWSHRRKLVAVSMSYLYVLGTGIATSLQYSVLADITKDTGISTANLVQGTGVMFLFFGWACLIWQPIALTYGRRGVYLITMLLTIPIMVWTAYSTSAGEWFAHRILIGIIVSPIESLCEVTVFDLFFAHNRGTYMSLYVAILFGSNFLAPLVAGWFNDAFGWRWTMHFGAIICAICFLIMFFFMEETMYFRGVSLESQSVTDNEHQDLRESKADGKADEGSPRNSLPSSPSVIYKDINSCWGKYTWFKVVTGRPSNTDMLRMVYRPVIMIFQFPTVAPVLSSNPYNWNAALVGCVYAGPIIGAAVACLWVGKAADWIALWLARRNGGIREPEQRLWVLLLSGIISSAGLITWGVGAYYHVHWIGLVFGLGETTVSIMLIRNTIGFGFSYAITPWWTTQGLKNCFITEAMISLACTLTFLVMIIYGKRIRRWSIPSYRKYMANMTVSHE
ncbi:major facilitator superfamily domain-containing protein [Fusarium oxysporum]|nr:major facilitator superfamily domain-containing protein [Fusarium oxysporum]